ncbi:DegT/DnrJ/EryC1/StrS family aminotransferase [Alphaproteobacteria bacterium]|nr:DegT/DnrJ/EryC1/StrS family aminotransferase [Alphaproteobacteria bacterium]
MKYYPLTTNTLSNLDKQNAIKVIKSGNITRGKYNLKVENFFSKKYNRYALLVNSGSSANLLALSLVVNKLGKYKFSNNDEVIIPTLCWSTSLYPIIQMNLKPVFVDINLENLNIDIDQLKKKITSKTKAIMLVHALGNCTSMNEIKKICFNKKITLIEDCCEALGSKYNNKYLGTFGEISTFSFYFSHHITSGEGGLVLCKNREDFKILLSLRAHGWSREIDQLNGNGNNKFDKLFNFVNLGYNLRLTDIQAALLSDQSKKIDQFRENRIFNYELILKSFKNSKILSKNLIFIQKQKNSQISWFNFPIILKNFNKIKRDNLCVKLNKLGIETRPIISGNFTQQKVILNLMKNISYEKFPKVDIVTNSGFMIGISSIKINKKIVEKLCKDLEKTIIKFV